MLALRSVVRAARPACRAVTFAPRVRPSAAFVRCMSDEAEKKSVGSLDLDFETMMGLDDALAEDGIQDKKSKTFVQPGVEENPELAMFDDILDIRNPPRLRAEHYDMLRTKHIAIDFTGRHDPVREQHEQNINNLAEQIQLLSDQLEEEFGITPDHSSVANTSGLPQDPRYLAIDPDPKNLGELEHEIQQLETPLMKRGECVFCQDDPTGYYRLEYTNIKMLRAFINRRGMIVNRRYSNNCAKHQRKVAQCIKRARVMGLMSFVSDWDVPVEFVQEGKQGPDGKPIPGGAPRSNLDMLNVHRVAEEVDEIDEVDIDSSDDDVLDAIMEEGMLADEKAAERRKQHDELREMRELAEQGQKPYKPSGRQANFANERMPDQKPAMTEEELEEQIERKRAHKAARLAREAELAGEKKDE